MSGGFGRELVQSAEEALAIARGEMAPARVSKPKSVDVSAIRKRQRLSQAAFAERYGLPLGTVRDWERKRQSPDQVAVTLLAIIEQQPDLVAEALASP